MREKERRVRERREIERVMKQTTYARRDRPKYLPMYFEVLNK